MKIKAFYDDEFKVIKMPCVLKTPHKRIMTSFVFDTGSPHTILNYTDSILLNIPRVKKSQFVRMGGEIYQSYIFNKLDALFKSDKGKVVKINIPIRVIKPNSQKIESVERLDMFPNLLGLDFLNQGYKFFCDISQKDIFFER